MDEISYPTVEQVLRLHAVIVHVSMDRVADHVRDLGLLESALARPRNEAAYEDAPLMRQAASLLWGIIKNHPFLDGNKRTAYVVTQAFLRDNGLSIQAPKDERFRFIIAIAENHSLRIAQTEDWLRRYVRYWP